MPSVKSALWISTCAAIAAMGCMASVDAEVTESDLNRASSEEALLSYLDKGDLALRQTQSGTLTNGDLGHFYKFSAAAGQTVTFAVEWKLPEANGLGAVVQVRNATGSAILAQHATLFSNQAHVVYTFATAGTYRIYAKPYGYALFGAYPYKVGADPDLCVVDDGTYDGFEPGVVNFSSGRNFPELVTTDPWIADDLGDGFHTTSHSVAFGDCVDLVNPSCGTAGPTVFESWFPTGTLEVVANVCEVKNDVYTTAGTTEGWLLWWDTCARYPEACQQ